MKRVVLAIDSFKGCLSSVEAEAAAEAGVREHWRDTEVVRIPVTDGGDGMLGVFSQLLDCKKITVGCHDALMRPIRAAYGMSAGGTVILETASACGISLLRKQELNPLHTTTYGVGELFADALRRGFRRFVVGLGGSATCDCGLGMLAALKDTFGAGWHDRLPQDLDITLASDVDNPLLGEQGAAAVFAPQKGATPQMAASLERRARTFARMAADHLGHDRSWDRGAGAAGGLGYADEQTLMGKISGRVLEYGIRKRVPVMLIAGRVSGAEALLHAGFTYVKCITPLGMPLEEAMRPAVAKENIRKALAEEDLP